MKSSVNFSQYSRYISLNSQFSLISQGINDFLASMV